MQLDVQAFYLTDMDHRSHHTNVHKYKRKRELFTKLSVLCGNI